MSIATAITNAQNKVAACYTSVDTMGGTLPETQNLSNLPTAIESIPTGGGTTYPGLDTDYNNGLATINKGALADYSVSDVTETGCIAKYTNVYNNFKIFGNPNINFGTGAIRGFSYNDYIQLPQSIPAYGYCSTMDMIFLAESTSVSDINSLLSQPSSLRFIGTNSETSTYSIYTGSWVNGTTVLQNNKKYWFRVIFDGTNWKGYLLEDDDYVLSSLPDISQWSYEWTTTTDIFRGQQLVIGRNYGQSSQYFRGTVNFSQAVIYVNGEEWWNAKGNSAIVKNYIYTNYTTVGSPIIDINTGLVKGFSTSDYIRIPNTFPSSISSADIIFKGKLDALSVDNPLIMQNRGYGCRGFYVTATGYFSYYDGIYTGGTHLLSTNKWYWFRIVLDNTYWRWYSLEDDNYTFETLPDISDWQYENQRQTDSFSSNVMNIGLGYLIESYYYWHGSIDLSQCIIKLNGNTWWNAKSSNYQQTYGLLNTNIPSETPELQINYNPVDRNYALGERNAVVASIVGNKSYVWGNGGLLNFSGYSSYPSYSISPNWGFVGSPTYNSSDMSYSGFSNDNYIATNYTFSMDATQFTKGFTIQAHVKTPSSFTGYYNKIFSCGTQYTYGPFLALNANGGGVYFAISSGGSILLSINVSTALSVNTEYWIRIVKPDTRYFSNNTILQLSTDGENWNTIGTSAETISTTVSADMKMILGVGGASYPTHIFTGNIYLDGTFIDYNTGTGNETTRVWDMVEETEMTPEPTPPTRVYNNFTTVGSPVINQSTGVVSGFSLSDYATLPNRFDASSNTWEMVWKVNYVDSEDQYQPIFGSTSYMGGNSGLSLATNNGKCCLWLSENGEDDWAMLNGAVGTTTMSNDTTYYIRVSFTGTHYLVELSTDGTTWNTEIDFTSSTPIHSFSPCFGQVEQWNDWHGSIDLSESYIKINGSTWWVGYTES